MHDWLPSASIDTLKHRARLLQRIRAFFQARQVLEVDTPVLSRAGVTDPHIESFTTEDLGQTFYLHTSPEFPMKRLLAAGSGDIFQLCKVFRCGESGRRHNPEFTLLEWYRIHMDHHQLMQEVDALVREVLQDRLELDDARYFSYQQLFGKFAGIDPFAVETRELKQCLEQQGIAVSGLAPDDRDAWLDIILTHLIEPALPQNCPVFIHDYPPSQAALARIRNDSPVVAERFELYINGMELANGFHELCDATEQRRRFEKENRGRQQAGLAEIPMDENLLAALQSGLPDCAGVALGVDRLLMLALGKTDIKDVLAFDGQRA